jgi:ATP-dependent DNA helicase RecQ
VLALAPDGREVAMGRERPLLELPAPPARRRRGRGAPLPAATPDASCDPELLARLKRWRTEEASRRSLPPYVVFHDRTLAAIAAARPGNAAELGTVKGVGPAKLAAYGDAVLALVRAPLD